MSSPVSTSTIISEDSTIDSDCSSLDFDRTFEDSFVTTNTSEQVFVPSLMQIDEGLKTASDTMIIGNEILESNAGEVLSQDSINVDRNGKEMNQVSNTVSSLYEKAKADGSLNHSHLDNVNTIKGVPEIIEDNNNSEATETRDEIQQSSANDDREKAHKVDITSSQAKRIAYTPINSDERADILDDNETTSNFIFSQNVESDFIHGNSAVPDLDTSSPTPVNQSRSDNPSVIFTEISPNINISSPVEVNDNTLVNDADEERLISKIDKILSDIFNKSPDYGNYRTIPKVPRQRSLSDNAYTVPNLSGDDIILDHNMESVEIHQGENEYSSELHEIKFEKGKSDHINEEFIDKMKLKEESIRNAYSGITVALKHQLMMYNNLREIIPEYVRRPVEGSIGIIRFSLDQAECVEPSDLMQDVLTPQEHNCVITSSTSPIEGSNGKDYLVKEQFESSQKTKDIKDIISSRAKKWHELPADIKEHYQKKAKRLRQKYSQNQLGPPQQQPHIVKPGKDESELLTVAVPKFSLRPVIPIVTMTQSQYIDFTQHKHQVEMKITSKVGKQDHSVLN
ncbi:1021_t:CDS:2 [Funneliformis geosporum]|uniref:4178_t:CDS:1 n=1 Tax=Funneliformis geosporum TaxID=1117311 RepID=A0A9W4WVQ3_9GLOM|nr:1021_t:CDS:2 [Funneliformis geosporum]CAI2167158.1 4178_t:CDS:2 [Funneliformis geosporum]